MVDLPATDAAVLVVDSIVLSDVLLTMGPIVGPFEAPTKCSSEFTIGCSAVHMANYVVLKEVLLLYPIIELFKRPLKAHLNCQWAVLLYLWPIL